MSDEDDTLQGYPCHGKVLKTSSSDDTGCVTVETVRSNLSADTDRGLDGCTSSESSPMEKLRLRRELTSIGETSFAEDYEVKEKLRPRKRIRHRALSGSVLLVLLAFLYLAMQPTSRRGSFGARRRIRKALSKIERQKNRPVKSDKLTIVLKGDRVDLLQQSLDHHARCYSVGSVHIHWTGEDGFPEMLYEYPSQAVYDMKEKIKTDAVLLLEEGLQFTCRDIERAFRVWESDRARLVGLLPPCRRCKYSVVSDSAAVIHRFLVPVIPEWPMPCQQYALSALIAAVSGKTPLELVTMPNSHAPRIDGPKQPIDDCVNDLKHELGIAVKSQRMTYVGRS